MKVLITSGGCKVPIDDVRHIGNFSSGRYGVELANSFRVNHHEVIMFREKGSAEYQWDDILYNDYNEYLNVKYLIKNLQPDIIISAAAISDYVVDKTQGKISSDSDELVIRLKKGEKVLNSFRELAPKALIVGFKLLVGPTDEQKSNAIKKVFASGVDLVVYNDLNRLRKGYQTRQVFGRHLGTKQTYDDSDAHNCPHATSVVEVISERYAHHKLEQLFGV